MFFINLLFSWTAEAWKTLEDQFNSTFDLYYDKVQNDAHINPFQYKTFIKAINSIRILLKEEVLFKHTADIMLKSEMEHMGIKLGKSL